MATNFREAQSLLIILVAIIKVQLRHLAIVSYNYTPIYVPTTYQYHDYKCRQELIIETLISECRVNWCGYTYARVVLCVIQCISKN